MKEKKTLLIVDDDPDDVSFFCEAVSDVLPDTDCLFAENGEDALDKLRNKFTSSPDLIFLDLNMPRMGGSQCLKELKNDSKLKNIPVVIFSTSTYQKDKDECHKLGATYFLSKPSDFNKLCEEIEYVVKEFCEM